MAFYIMLSLEILCLFIILLFRTNLLAKSFLFIFCIRLLRGRVYRIRGIHVIRCSTLLFKWFTKLSYLKGSLGIYVGGRKLPLAGILSIA